MTTARDVIAAIGRDRFRQMLAVGEKSLRRAEAQNEFTASWYGAIHAEYRDREDIDSDPPSMSLFNFKDRQ